MLVLKKNCWSNLCTPSKTVRITSGQERKEQKLYGTGNGYNLSWEYIVHCSQNLPETFNQPTKPPGQLSNQSRLKASNFLHLFRFVRNKVCPGIVNGPVAPLSTVEALRKFQKWKDGNYKTSLRINALWKLTASPRVSYARTAGEHCAPYIFLTWIGK